MQVRVLGCSGGIGADRHTTAFLIDDWLLLDAGTGVARLSLEEMQPLQHVLLTHSHMDHIAALPLLLDTVFGRRESPLEVHASAAVLEVLRAHVFNWQVWPDFSQLPDPQRAVMGFTAQRTGAAFELGGYRVTGVEVNHVVPCCAYIIEAPQGVFCFSGDTTTTDALWAALNALPRLDLLFVECAFPDRQERLAGVAKHYCPSSLAADLGKLRHDPVIGVSHFKPGSESETLAQLHELLPQRKLQALEPDQRFTV